MEIQINRELKGIIPALTADEYKSLEESILNEGCREALVLWNETIVDGHNRYEICNKHQIEFKTIQKEFEDINEAKKWVIKNQLSRRNISEAQRIILALTFEKIIEHQSYLRKISGKKIDLEADQPQGRTRAKISEIAKSSEHKVDKVKKIREKASEEVKQKVISGEMSINEGYKTLDIPHVAQQTGEYEWYTPKEIIEAARKTMGSIDLDAASCELANETIMATKYFTEKDDALLQEWRGNVWLNPPYARGIIDKFSTKAIQELFNITQLTMIVNNATETNWLQNLVEECNALCLVRGRVKFWNMDENRTGSPLQGQVVLYFGDNQIKFIENFSEFGICMKKAL
jgi:phage N-6-adenine-methyltransferase